MGNLLSRSYDRLEVEGLAELHVEAAEAVAAMTTGGGGVDVGAAAAAAGGAQDLSQLPACVRRYLEVAATGGDAASYRLVTARQAGEFRYDPQGPWQPLTASQCACPLVPAFFWAARCPYKPLVGMKGFDCRLRGRGRIDWRLWGWVPALAASGPLLDQSMLVRWLAETPGFPQAMLPSPALRWEAVPGAGNEARAVLMHAGSTVSGVFAFDEAGLVCSFRSEDHVRPLPGGRTQRCAWGVRYAEHKSMPLDTAAVGRSNGSATAPAAAAAAAFVPTRSEAMWVLPNGQEFVYVRFRLEALAATAATAE